MRIKIDQFPSLTALEKKKDKKKTKTHEFHLK